MAFSLGSKKPKKEVELSPFMSWVLIIGWVILMGLIITFLLNKYAMSEVNQYIICSNGDKIKFIENRTMYCGMYFESFEAAQEYIDEELARIEADDDYIHYKVNDITADYAINESLNNYIGEINE